MKKVFIFFLSVVFPGLNLSILAQHKTAADFFSSVPQMISEYTSPGNPCENSIEFTINNYGTNPIALKADNITKDSKGKAKVNFSESGNKTIWYKIVFETDCELTFRIYSDKAEDIYHYFVYQQDESKDFCQWLSKKSVVPIRANMLEHKEGIIGTGLAEGIKINYKDTSDFYLKRILLHTPFLDGIKGKAGETYYLNIYHMGGADAFHYLVLSSCYREVNLKTVNENISSKKAEIIEKLPEHVTKPPAEKTQAEKDSLAALQKAKEMEAKKKAENEKKEKAAAEAKKKAEAEARKKAEKEAALKAKAEAAEKAKAEAAEKKIAEAKARQMAAENAKRIVKTKKISPQLVEMNEKDTLNQYLVEGEIYYMKDPVGPVVQVEIYLFNTDGTISVAKKIYTNEKGMFRFANMPSDHNYNFSLNISDPNLMPGSDPELKGKLTLKGLPAAGILINNSVKTAEDGSFTLSKKELFSIDIKDLFERWSIDLSDTQAYEEFLRKYGGVFIEGLVYRVQIGAYRQEENFNYSFMNDLGKVDLQSLQDGITRFVMGEFSTLKEAEAFKQKAIERKVKDAFILAYFNGNKKFLEELIEKKMLDK